MEKLNLGCGFQKKEGYLNVDCDVLANPDEVVDLEKTPWPWRNEQFKEIIMEHVLEHLGDTTKNFLDIIKELWRVSKPGAQIHIAIPHHRSDTAITDPTHKRLITSGTLAMFDQMRNWHDLQQKGHETKLGLQLGVDFEIMNLGYLFNEPWHSGIASGQVSREQAERDALLMNNVIIETSLVLKVHKPCRVRSSDQTMPLG